MESKEEIFWGAPAKVTNDTSKDMKTVRYVEQLETRIAELITERDEYDKRRRAAMEKCEEWRVRYNSKLKGDQ
jgi:hypothetical protein